MFSISVITSEFELSDAIVSTLEFKSSILPDKDLKSSILALISVKLSERVLSSFVFILPISSIIVRLELSETILSTFEFNSFNFSDTVVSIVSSFVLILPISSITGIFALSTFEIISERVSAIFSSFSCKLSIISLFFSGLYFAIINCETLTTNNFIFLAKAFMLFTISSCFKAALSLLEIIVSTL